MSKGNHNLEGKTFFSAFFILLTRDVLKVPKIMTRKNKLPLRKVFTFGRIFVSIFFVSLVRFFTVGRFFNDKKIPFKYKEKFNSIPYV